MKPDIDLVAQCIGVIAKEYGLNSKDTESLARIVKATVDTYVDKNVDGRAGER